jgi:hypothetical protein
MLTARAALKAVHRPCFTIITQMVVLHATVQCKGLQHTLQLQHTASTTELPHSHHNVNNISPFSIICSQAAAAAAGAAAGSLHSCATHFACSQVDDVCT